MMHWTPDDFSEYGETPREADYADPSYYQPDTSSVPHSAQPVQPLKSYSDYTHGPTIVNSYDPALMTEYQEYRGPSSLEGYTTDAGSEQREASERGNAGDGSKKRKGLAGLGGIGAAIGALLLKFPVLGLVLKFGWAGISAIASILVYSFIFGLQFAV